MGNAVSYLLNDVQIPKMFKVKQVFSRNKVEREDIPEIIFNLLSDDKFSRKIKYGMKIAITAGSRGISNIDIITKSIVDFVKLKGGLPFIVPSMGSHGGADANVQRKIIEEYNITEEFCGCPILSSMEVKKIGVTEDGKDVFIDKNAANADGIIVACRIKPHTNFRGPYESGIMKMLAIGLGKQIGAEKCHESGFKHMAKYIPLFGKAVIKNSNILFAVSTIENSFEETYKLSVVNSEEVETLEPELLKEAFYMMPSILINEADVLIIDAIGKNYSGSGMDPNITGTWPEEYASGGLKCQRTCVLDISDESHGNGSGIGLCDATTRRVFDKLDLESVYANCITALVPVSAKIPFIMESDKEAIKACIKTCVDIERNNIRMVRIPNSLHIEHIMLSEYYYDKIKGFDKLIIESEPEYMNFDHKGNLL